MSTSGYRNRQVLAHPIHNALPGVAEPRGALKLLTTPLCGRSQKPPPSPTHSPYYDLRGRRPERRSIHGFGKKPRL